MQNGSLRRAVLLITALIVIIGVLNTFSSSPGTDADEQNQQVKDPDLQNRDPDLQNHDPDEDKAGTEAKALHEAEEYWALRRGDLNPSVLDAARARAATLPLEKQLPAAPQRGSTTVNTATIRYPPNGAWQALGPAPINVGGIAGNYAGRVSALAVDPTTSGNSTTIYLGAANGGVWKSVNNGVSWTPLTDSQNSLATGAITIDPNNHNVIYVGTGEPNQSLDSYFGVGVLKSIDGGASWTQYGFITFGNRSSSIQQIVVNPLNSSQVFVASTIGLFVSNDAGQTYTQVGGGLPAGKQIVDGLQIDGTVNPPRLYVTIRGQGLYRSVNGGANWIQAGSILPLAGTWFRSALAVAPSSPNVIYTVITSDDSYGDVSTFDYNGGYFSIDYGVNWSQLSGLNINFTNGGFGAQGWYNLGLTVDPRNYNVVYGLGVDVAVTTGGTTGAGWNNISSVYGIAGTNNSGIHPDQHAIAFGNCSPTLCSVYIGNDGGVYFSSNTTAPRDSVSYANLNTPGLAIAEFTGGDVAANFGRQPFALGGTQDNGSLLYANNPRWGSIYGGDGGFAQVDWSESNTLYITNFYISLAKSTDGGFSLNGASNGLSGKSLFYMPYQLDRSSSRHLVAGTNAVFETINGAGSWYQSSQVFCKRTASSCNLTSSTAVSVSAVTVAPTNGAIIYAGTSDGQLFKATNGAIGAAASFAHVNDGVFANKYITQITVDPVNPNIVYVSAGHYYYNSGSGYIFRSTDGGVSWVDISGALPVIPINSVVVYYSNVGRVIVIGTDIGVFFSTNEGANWSRLGTGLPNTAVVQLALDAQRTAIIAFTHGRGAWTLPIPAAYVSASPGIGVYRPSARTFYLRYAMSGGPVDVTIPLTYNQPTDLPLAGDWNGDGYDTVGLFRDGIFLLWDDNSGKFMPDYAFVLGNPGDRPLAGDWTGRGRSGVGVFRPSNGVVFLKNNLSSGDPDFLMVYGDPGDVPMAGDWDGDGRATVGVYQPNNGLVHMTNQSCWFCIPLANYVIVYGNPGWSVFSGDWINSGRAGLGVFSPADAHIYLRNDPTTTGFSDTDFFYGSPEDRPIAGRWLHSGSNPPAMLNPPSIIVPRSPPTATPVPGSDGTFD